jgi:hypothetical protein
MKGTLLSFDYVKSPEGDLKFVEMNTDTTIPASEVNTALEWSSLFTVMQEVNATKLDVIYKPQIHQEIVNALSASAQGESFITDFTHHKEDYHSIFPAAVTDEADKFILRLAYDDNAILDNTYCATGHSPLRLLNEYNSSSLAVPFYYSGSEGEIDNLTSSSNSSNIPDLAAKTKRDTWDALKFVKVRDWSTVKGELKGDYYLTNYLIHSSSEDTQQAVSSFRQYAIAYGGGLNMCNVGSFQQYSQFSIPEVLDLADDGMNKVLDNKHYYEYSTSTIKSKMTYNGVFVTERLLAADNGALQASEINTGQAMKGFHIEGAPDTENIADYSAWRHVGKALPANSGVTSSIAVSNAAVHTNLHNDVFMIHPSGSTTPVYLGVDSAVITYNSGSNTWAYRQPHQINKDLDYVFNTDNELVPILDSRHIILHSPTGSFFTVDIETNDNLVVDTEDANNEVVISFHNPPQKLEPPK